LSPNSNVIPEEARRALHNLPVMHNHGVAIDLVEFPEMEHIGIRVYVGQIDPLDTPAKMQIIERMYLIQKVLRSFGVSCSLEKVAGLPPKR
jgi:hypothetical protein